MSTRWSLILLVFIRVHSWLKELFSVFLNKYDGGGHRPQAGTLAPPPWAPRRFVPIIGFCPLRSWQHSRARQILPRPRLITRRIAGGNPQVPPGTPGVPVENHQIPAGNPCGFSRTPHLPARNAPAPVGTRAFPPGTLMFPPTIRGLPPGTCSFRWKLADSRPQSGGNRPIAQEMDIPAGAARTSPSPHGKIDRAAVRRNISVE